MNIGTKVKFKHEGKSLVGWILEVQDRKDGQDVVTVRCGRRLISVATERCTAV